MAEVLTPGFELLGGAAASFAKLGKCCAEAVWIEIGQPGIREYCFEYPADRACIASMFARQARSFKQLRFTNRYLGGRE